MFAWTGMPLSESWPLTWTLLAVDTADRTELWSEEALGSEGALLLLQALRPAVRQAASPHAHASILASTFIDRDTPDL
jgi:hypothetical protein